MPDHYKDDQTTHRFEGWLGYTPANKWAYEYQFIYFKTDYIRYDNKKSDYEQNLIVKYKLTKQWAPFMEIGDIKVESTSPTARLAGVWACNTTSCKQRAAFAWRARIACQAGTPPPTLFTTA